MFKELTEHKIAYLFLIIFLVLGVILFLGAWPDRGLQRLIAIGIAIFYLGWGLITHVHSNKLNKRVFFEYLGISFIAGLLMTLITF